MLADTRYGWDADQECRPIAIAVRSTCLPSATCDCRCSKRSISPIMLNSCPRRTDTTTAPQALEMLNGEMTERSGPPVERQAAARNAANDEAKLVREAYAEAYGRPPQDARDQDGREVRRTASGRNCARKRRRPTTSNCRCRCRRKSIAPKAAAIVDFCHAMLCSNEFLYVD